VVEGHVSDLTVLGSNRTARRQATAALSPLVNKTPLSLADVETAYQEAKDVPGLSVSGTLRAGSVPGGMDMVVATQRDEWRVYANVNDLYADTVGPWGVLVGVDHFGASQFGDQASLQVYTSVPVDRQILVRGSDSWRLDDTGTTLTLSALWGQAHPQGNLQVLAIAQDVTSLRADVAQPIWDRPGSKLQVDLALEGSDQKTDVFKTFNLSDDRLRDLSLSVTGEQKGAFGRFAYSAELHKNLKIIGASTEGSPDLSRFGADPEAMIYRGSAEAETPTFAHMRVDLRAEGQFTNDPLTIPDQYSAGNLTIGRGYQPGAALGDRAVGESAELRVGPFDIAHKVQIEPFGFADVLDLWNIGYAPFEHRQLTSVGGGVRFQFNGKAHLDLLCAVPQDPPLGLGERTPSPMVLMNLTVSVSDAFQAIHQKLFPGGGT